MNRFGTYQGTTLSRAEEGIAKDSGFETVSQPEVRSGGGAKLHTTIEIAAQRRH